MSYIMCILQLINEPWAGDIYSKPSLLMPGVNINELHEYYYAVNVLY